MSDKLRVYDELTLKCTAPWVEAPSTLVVPHNGRNFEVQVNPVGLEPGLHYAEVQGYNHKAMSRGPLFRYEMYPTPANVNFSLFMLLSVSFQHKSSAAMVKSLAFVLHL